MESHIVSGHCHLGRYLEGLLSHVVRILYGVDKRNLEVESGRQLLIVLLESMQQDSIVLWDYH